MMADREHSSCPSVEAAVRQHPSPASLTVHNRRIAGQLTAWWLPAQLKHLPPSMRPDRTNQEVQKLVFLV